MRLKKLKSAPFNHHHLIFVCWAKETLTLQPLSFLFFQLTLGDEQCEVTRNGYETKELVYLVHIYCQVRWRTPSVDGAVLHRHTYFPNIPLEYAYTVYVHLFRDMNTLLPLSRDRLKHLPHCFKNPNYAGNEKSSTPSLLQLSLCTLTMLLFILGCLKMFSQLCFAAANPLSTFSKIYYLVIIVLISPSVVRSFISFIAKVKIKTVVFIICKIPFIFIICYNICRVLHDI